MIIRSFPIMALLLCGGAWGCSGSNASDSTTGASADTAADQSKPSAPIENVDQYKDCLFNGPGGTNDINLGHLTSNDPAADSSFVAASCIINKVNKLQNPEQPYNLQSVKTTAIAGAAGVDGFTHMTFIFRRDVLLGGQTPACLKVKLATQVGATDLSQILERVKQLPTPRHDGLCADNGEI